MAKPELIARQSRRPSGWLGEIVGRVMAFDTARANRVAAQQLAVQAGEAVLEIGCGHGRTLARIAQAPCGFLAGIDASEVMVRLARRRLHRQIEAGRAEVSLASSTALPYPDARFDAALAVHVVYFWKDASTDLREIRRVLRPGGRLLLGYRPLDAEALAALPATVYSLRSVEETEGLLAEAGFAAIRSTDHPIGKSGITCTIAFVPTSRRL
ncbi:MAG TPA: class I SAM-dependent methyltransferase [Myxococcota bacterium]|jgi:SAM-dependent methyltransferase